MIDATDKKIVGILQENARLSNAEIAEAVGLTASSVHERVKKLEKKGILTRYAAMVNADRIGKPLLAFIRLTIGAHQAVSEGIQRLCASEPDILECHNVAGEDCYILKVRAAGPKELEKLLSAIRTRADSVRSVTNIVLSTYKETPYVEPGVDGHDEKEGR